MSVLLMVLAVSVAAALTGFGLAILFGVIEP